MRERALIRFNLNGEDRVVGYELDELAIMLADKGEYEQLRILAERHLVDNIADYILKEAGIVWVEEIDYQYDMRIRNGTINNGYKN